MVDVQGIDAVIIHSRDAEGLADWYARRLGIRTSWYEEGGYWHGDLEHAETGVRLQIAFLPADEDEDLAEGSAITLNYRVGDLDRAVEELEEAGVAIERRVEDRFGRFLRLRDPDGNPIELWTPVTPEEPDDEERG